MADEKPKAFQREERFIVIKRKHLHPMTEASLRNEMRELGIQTVECVVVESDWPEYEIVWRMIKERVTGTITPDPELSALREEVSALRGRQKLSLVDQHREVVGFEYISFADLHRREVYVDEDGTVWTPPTAWAYRQACKATDALRERVKELEGALRNIQIEADREQGSWVHLKRVIALIARATLSKGAGNNG